jgi:putative molybdopterin biosynthesis protein
MKKDLSNPLFLETVPLENALRILFERLKHLNIFPLPEESIKVVDSLGRITSEPVYARYSSPSYHSSAMDGYAVRFTDTFTASERLPSLLRLGSDAIYVNTGDPLPDGFNAVIMVEDVNIVRRLGETFIEIYQPVSPYQHVRTIGEDIVTTELIIPQNHEIRPIDIGAMLASGNLYVNVVRKPIIAVIPTGTELVDPEVVLDRSPNPPEIIEYNSAMLLNLINELGAEGVRSPIIMDDPERLRRSMEDALKVSDMVIINAGSGRGTKDYTLSVIKDMGEVIISGLSIKPGKPLIVGIIKNKPVFGIPGYPVSAFITFSLFVKPLILRMLGKRENKDRTIKAILSRKLSSPLGVDEFVRVKVGSVNNRFIATPIGRGAGLLMSLVRADGIIRVPSNIEALSAGMDVDVLLLKDEADIKDTIVCIGSHDNILDILANWIRKRFPSYSFSSAHVGSMGGIMAIKKAEAHIAGTHLLDESSGEYNIPFIKRFLPDKNVVLINLVYRQQGLLVKKGNPKGIRGFEDLLREDIFFINRQAGSGTRLLLDKYLKEKNINPYLIKGYEKEEYTHMAVASAVSSGLADTGLAIYSSARALDLDFIPVAKERYDLIIPKDIIDDEKIKALLDIIRDDKEFRLKVEALGGYNTEDMGKIIYES